MTQRYPNLNWRCRGQQLAQGRDGICHGRHHLLVAPADPAGRTLSSDGFKDEYFYLDVPADTADSGDYCCQLDCRAPDFCCLDDQSPLRSCATIPVHKHTKVEITTDDKMSLGNVTQAMAYLVHRQARCDQLDTYITKVETLQVDMLKGIENMRNMTTDARVQLERETNHKLWNFQLQMDSNASKVMESCNVSQQQLLTTVSDKLLELETKLNKDLADLHNASFTADRRLEANINESAEHLQKRTCLKLSTRQVDYTTAKANCEADGAHLYAVRYPVLDEERVSFAIKRRGLSLDIDIWVGGNDLEFEGDYRWSDGTPLSSSSKLWETGQPSDNDKSENCIALSVTKLKFVLRDYRCSYQMGYLCQYDV
ncbi:hypothetical protein C0Q70_07360 [Pomacea canaliculata]|uniref:C-type lectin domain-containing protein n=1 Tax=Pomacea canaliculata TaxID=400727 RepID=A0A2T7PEU9_POMCA|nr:hypothetical protein C0Q70_07360 [Pomacea canaliculata]